MKTLNNYSKEELIRIGLDNGQGKEEYQNLGILRFLKILFPERFTSEFGKLHYDMAMTFLELFNPNRERRINKQAYFLVHREAAKSTLGSFGFIMWAILLNGRKVFVKNEKETFSFTLNEKFIMIISETSSAAEDFVTGIKDQLDTRKDLAVIFGEKSPVYVTGDNERARDKKWTKTIFKTADGIYVRGLGAAQQVRGRNLGGNRPTLCIVDDMYSENNVKTSARREHLSNWFYNALTNSLDSIKGKMLWLGTLVHPDIVVKDMRESEDWFGINKPLMSLEELQKLISICNTENGFTINKQHLLSIQNEFKSISWSQRYNLPYIAHLYKSNAIDKNRGNGFYQEYMNEAVSPDSKSISEDTFKPVDFKITKKGDNIFISFFENTIEWTGVCSLNVGVDMAATIKDKSDISVIICAGYAKVYPKYQGKTIEYGLSKYKNGKIIPVIIDCDYGKMDIFQYMERKGMYESCMYMYEQYNPQYIVIEANGQQALAVREIDKKFREKGIYGKIVEEYVNINKEERINSILKPIIQKYKHFYCQKGDYIKILYHQMLLLGLTDHDDFPDALEECFKYEPKVKNIYPDEFELYKEEEYEFNQKYTNWYYH